MIEPPEFASILEHKSRTGDVSYWWPYLSEVLGRHDLLDAEIEPVAGFNPTNPTFVYGEVVVKLFGHYPWWRSAHAPEKAALELVTTDPGIAAPKLVGDGRLYDDPEDPWPYLVMTRVSGASLHEAQLSDEEALSVAAELGNQVRRMHALRPTDDLPRSSWPAADAAEAAERSSLPPHLSAQVNEYLGRLGSFDSVFTNGDIVAAHVFVENGRLAGIIDWGDALVTDRHYELIQIYRDAFACDKTLFRSFLEAAQWPVDEEFPHRTMGLALHRQAVGLTQHHTIDVFMPIAERFPLEDIATLDELATLLFEV